MFQIRDVSLLEISAKLLSRIRIRANSYPAHKSCLKCSNCLSCSKIVILTLFLVDFYPKNDVKIDYQIKNRENWLEPPSLRSKPSLLLLLSRKMTTFSTEIHVKNQIILSRISRISMLICEQAHISGPEP